MGYSLRILAVVLPLCGGCSPAYGQTVDAGQVEASALNYYVFTATVAAFRVAAAVDEAGGYPKAGIDIGGGVHVPPDASVTTGYAAVLQHPSGTKWAYQADSVVVPIVGPNAIQYDLGVAAPLDATWYPDSGANAVQIGN